jgi:hypothetical protein
MKSKMMGILLCMALLVSLLAGVAMPAPVAATDPTTSLTVTKYDTDGTTIIQQEELDLAELQALPVQGDNVTHYFSQGPTFIPANLWDPAEIENLKDKGAVKGTDVKDLCELVGGAASGDLIQIKASDGLFENFHYDDVYNPEPAQGKFVICWEKNGDTVPTFAEGLQLVFFAQTTNADGKYVFGNQDMHDYLPEDNWHYFNDGVTNYPSANGISIKWINEVNVFTAPPPPWELQLVGANTYVMSQNEFENGVACTSGDHGYTWTDGSDNVWKGLPLWLLCGWVDDNNQHGIGAFNDALARAGYTVRVSAVGDNTTCELSSDLVARNNDIIVANTMNDLPLPRTGDTPPYPLKLVGSELEESEMVVNIEKIELVNLPAIQTWQIALSGAISHNLTQAEFEDGVICFAAEHAKEYTDANGTWRGLPLWLLCGWVDDDIQHGPGAFNDALADRGYDIVVSSDNISYTFDSHDVARNDDIIVANTLDDSELPPDKYPLKIVGSDVSDNMSVSRIARIELTPPKIPAVVGDYSIKGSIKFYDWKCNKWIVVQSGTLHITEQNEHKIKGYFEPGVAIEGWPTLAPVNGYVGAFERSTKLKIRNTPRLSLVAEFGEYCKYTEEPSVTYVTYILNAKIKMDKKKETVKSMKCTINGWGEFGSAFDDGSPSIGQFEGKFTATPIP